MLKQVRGAWHTLKPVTMLGRRDDGSVAALAWSDDKRLVASAGPDGVHIWDLATGGCRPVPEPPPDPMALARSPENSSLAVGSRAGRVAINDLDTPRVRRDSAVGHVGCLAWTRHGLVAGGAGGPVVLAVT